MAGHQASASDDFSNDYHFIETPERSDTEGAQRPNQPRRAPKHVREVSKQQAAMQSEIQELRGYVQFHVQFQYNFMCAMQQQISDLQQAINEKMDKADFQQALSEKIDKFDFEQALDEKVCRADFEQLLSKKVDEVDFKQALSKKMDETDFKQAFSEKIDKADFEQALSKKIDKIDFEQALNEKMGKADVEQALSEKISNAVFEEALNKKVDEVDFEQALNLKMDKADFGRALSEKMRQANFMHALLQKVDTADLKRAFFLNIKVKWCNPNGIGKVHDLRVLYADTIATVATSAEATVAASDGYQPWMWEPRGLKLQRAGSHTFLDNALTIMHYGIRDDEVLYLKVAA